MALQDPGRLLIDGLSILGDPRPNAAQPLLENGIHVRWTFGGETAFPPYGYYLFRRSHPDVGERCFGSVIGSLKPGLVPNNELRTPQGTFTATQLIAVDAFEPPGAGELSLANGLTFTLPPQTITRRVFARIGLGEMQRTFKTRSISFEGMAEGTGPNPRVEQDVKFEVFAAPGVLAKETRLHRIAGALGLDCGRRILITLPDATTSVALSAVRGGPAIPMTMKAFLRDGSMIETPGIEAPGSPLADFSASSKTPIDRVVLEPPTEAVILRMTVSSDAGPPEIVLTGLAGSNVVASATVRGAPREIVAMELAGIGINTVRISAGNAALLELCYSTCLSNYLAPLARGAVKGNTVQTPYGTLTGASMTAVDHFESSGVVEISLANDGVRFALPRDATTRRARVRLGFAPPHEDVRTEVGFRERPAGEGPNPFEESGLRFDVQNEKGSRLRRLRETPGGTALECDRRLIITMPARAINVHMQFRRRAADPPSVVKMFLPDGKLAGEIALATGENVGIGTQSNLVLGSFVIESPGDLLLYSVSWSTQPKPAEVTITPFAGVRALQGIIVRGGAKQTSSTEVTGEGITAIEITSGDAVLIDICYERQAIDGAVGAPGPWMFVPSFVYPLTLPITHPSYPASSGVEALETRRGPAGLRIRYGPVADALPPPQRQPGNGTISLTPGSAIAKGQNTAWNDAHVGMLLYPASANTALAVMTVLAPDRVVLSRPFTGAQPLQNVAYDIAQEDIFAQVHDQLGGLLSATNGMRKATMPPVLDVSGPGRAIFLIDQASSAKGIGTTWTTDHAGLLLEVGPNADVYRITAVNAVTQELTLHTKYVGPTGPAPYRIVSRSPHNRVDEGPALAIPPLALIEIAALSPAYAQLLGLYWNDQSAEAGRTYDYIVIADHDGRFKRNAATAQAYANGIADFSGTGVDAAILAGITHSGSGALPAPASLRALALPAGRLATTLARPDLADSDPALTITDLASWPSLPAASRPLMLDVWRVAHGPQQPPASPPLPAAHTHIGDRLLPQFRVSDPAMPRPPGWPDPASIHFLDGDGGNGLDVGWYSYRVSAVDHWGRMSALSPPIPWYSTPNSATPIHAHAVHLEDRVPPPPPTDLMAWVLEPENVPGVAPDPSLIKDAPYVAWRQQVGPNVRGLRLRWRWPWSHQLRAPDLQEFRVYAQSTPLNARLHRIVSVVPATGDPTRSDVTLAAGDALAANAYAGTMLQSNKRAYPIEASSGGTQLVLRVRNGGPTGGEPPAPGAGATIVIDDPQHLLYRDLLDPLQWERFLGPVAQHTPSIASIRYDVDPIEDPGVRLFDDPQNPLHGVTADWDGVRVRIDDLPPQPPLTAVRPGIDVIALGHDDTGRYAILEIGSIDAAQMAVHPATPVPAWLAAGTYRWSIGPLTQDARGLDGQWNAAAQRLEMTGQPDLSRVRPGIDRIYVQTNVAATPQDLQQFFDIDAVDVNQRRLVLRGATGLLTDGAKYAWRIGKPVRIYEVFLPSGASSGDDPQIAQWMAPSLANPIVYATVGVSGADKRTERPDLRPNRTPPRKGNEGLLAGPATVFRVHRDVPDAPADDAWDASRLWATRADYHGKSYFTVRWKKPPPAKLPHYKAIVLRAVDETLFDVDFHLDPPRTFPLTAGMLAAATPSHWTPSRKAAIAAEFIGATSTYEAIHTATAFDLAQPLYRSFTDDAFSVLANLPGNDEAFAQISIHAVDLTDPANEDRRGPDDELSSFPGINPLLNATLDELDGRSQNRYLYKVAFVDTANHRGPLGKASPAVHLPKVVPPRAPVITKVLGGDRKITLHWAANREPDLAGYRVYRTEVEANARDLRLMEVVGEVGAGETSYEDTVRGLVNFYYRISAIDATDNESQSSSSVGGRAFHNTPPTPPIWSTVRWIDDGGQPAVELEWTADAPGLICLLQRRAADGGTWGSVADGLTAVAPNSWRFKDATVAQGVAYRYRIRAQDIAGNVNVTYNEFFLPSALLLEHT